MYNYIAVLIIVSATAIASNNIDFSADELFSCSLDLLSLLTIDSPTPIFEGI